MVQPVDAILDTASRQALRAAAIDEAHAAMLVEAIERGEDDAGVLTAQLDCLVLVAERRKADFNELCQEAEQEQLRSIHDRVLSYT